MRGFVDEKVPLFLFWARLKHPTDEKKSTAERRKMIAAMFYESIRAAAQYYFPPKVTYEFSILEVDLAKLPSADVPIDIVIFPNA
ncbi:hypothetical protein H2200_002089 [Cladophialophora chaetospira]|uniref:Uncharacterized protein n=1 Tax=Cladophialophora chaetospira TaxID=386627 RepID=A0AA38XIX5_9EURO|nr:hypothetical protein H2200_002089 [Cladophialophora chaetospira]